MKIGEIKVAMDDYDELLIEITKKLDFVTVKDMQTDLEAFFSKVPIAAGLVPGFWWYSYSKKEWVYSDKRPTQKERHG